MRNDIGSTLRDLRQAAGKEAKAVARSAAMSPSKLSRIETGKAKPTTIDVDRILTALGVPDAVRSDLVEIARQEATEVVAWRFLRRTGLHHHRPGKQQRLRCPVPALFSLSRGRSIRPPIW
ncbi:helix-turn-helix domain-containing protein [Kitasatospora sp. NPDC058032]|uniref:helix-turn-helix domain-containing protein n=1 Tax=Kitasatospora sp. NPDC058032 TaxID=3346307 RepID=UPI0036DB2C5C